MPESSLALGGDRMSGIVFARRAPLTWETFIADFTRYAPYVPLPIDWRGSDWRDGEWHAVVTLPHEAVEHEGKVVPLFEDYGGDVERQEWERERARR